ncbi:MAG: 50S ribosomal protein L17 [Bacteroidales bacterium]|nr:50S ribosomal protein L17 [Bacteroidales bacterium]
MRHGKNFNHLGRQSAHRKAMLSNMAVSLLLHKRINTTVAKAKALRMYIEPIITQAKEDTAHNRRVVFSELQDKKAVSELFREVIVKIGERPGGYTRILRTTSRLGDGAEMCMMELVDYNESLLGTKSAQKKSRRSRKKATPAGKAAEPKKKADSSEKETTKKPEAKAKKAPAKVSKPKAEKPDKTAE